MVVGVLPALRSAAAAPLETLKSSSLPLPRVATGSASANALVGLEVALSAALLVTAGLLGASFLRDEVVADAVQARPEIKIILTSGQPGAALLQTPRSLRYRLAAGDSLRTERRNPEQPPRLLPDGGPEQSQSHPRWSFHRRGYSRPCAT